MIHDQQQRLPMKTFILACLLALTAVLGVVVTSQSAAAHDCDGCVGNRHGR
jgi:hypothetical protein